MTLRHLRRIERLRPGNPDELHEFVRKLLGLNVPRRPVVAGNSAPFAYLVWGYFEGRVQEIGYRIRQEEAKTRSVPGDATMGGARPRASGGGTAAVPGDCVVWANRGGGKTMLGAAATVLDLLFKPGIEVRILGGSLEQSSRMFRYLVQLLSRRGLRGTLRGRPTQRRVELWNGSVAEVLAQSQCSVRGTRVHKLRCDEVEEFDPEVWDAAQRVTRSQRLGGIEVSGGVEALSTMHRPFGLMAKLVEQGGVSNASGGEGRSEEAKTPSDADESRVLNRQITKSPDRQIFRWCALDVAEKCDPRMYRCEGCRIFEDCQGRAREAEGFMPIGDLIAQWWRSSNEAWSSEMMCRQPRRSECVYPGFDAAEGGRHVGEVNGGSWMVNGEGGGVPRPASVPPAAAGESAVRRSASDTADLSRLGESVRAGRGTPEHSFLVAGMDFGMRSPLVMLWGRVEEPRITGDRPAPPDGARGLNEDVRLEILDEYAESGLPLEEHLRRIAARGRERGWATPAWIGVDPAGNQRNGQTGQTDVAVLRRHGYVVRARPSRLAWGIERIRARLDHGSLRIHPRCTQLIQALSTYHFDPRNPERQQPVKDGPDHLCDALRYLVVNLETGGCIKTRGY